MTTLDFSRNRDGFSFRDLIAAARLALQRRAIYRDTVRQLSELRDADLADIGLHRSMIHEVAREGARRFQPA